MKTEKCYLHAIRNWKLLIFQFLIPTWMTILAIIQILTVPEIGAQPELDLSLSPYKSNLTKIPLDIDTPLSLTTENEKLFKNIIKDSTLTTVNDIGFVLTKKRKFIEQNIRLTHIGKSRKLFPKNGR